MLQIRSDRRKKISVESREFFGNRRSGRYRPPHRIFLQDKKINAPENAAITPLEKIRSIRRLSGASV
jgi:hypothetical protein